MLALTLMLVDETGTRRQSLSTSKVIEAVKELALTGTAATHPLRRPPWLS